ncbi:MAG: WxL domain-containing protein [Patescibacteria group bacterium]|nr:WxL domain-containing protein [Patescibacteria group bacterium]
MKKIFVLILIFGLFSLAGWLGFIEAATTNMDLSMGAGTLSLTSSGTASLIGKTVSTSSQNSTGTIANVSVTDTRGSGAGWSVVMTSQHFTATGTTKTLAGSNSTTVDFTGKYDGLDGVLDPNGTFLVEITTGGSVGTAIFKWTDPAGNLTSNVTTSASVVLSNGISVTFGVATYVIGDKWSAGVDVFPYTGFTITPGSVTAASGSLTGVTAGIAEALAGSGVTSDAKTLITAAVNNGFGDYDQAPSLSLTIHANSLAGSFTADATITVS